MFLEDIIFVWVGYGKDDYVSVRICMCLREVSDYEKLYKFGCIDSCVILKRVL